MMIRESAENCLSRGKFDRLEMTALERLLGAGALCRIPQPTGPAGVASCSPSSVVRTNRLSGLGRMEGRLQGQVPCASLNNCPSSQGEFCLSGALPEKGSTLA